MELLSQMLGESRTTAGAAVEAAAAALHALCADPSTAERVLELGLSATLVHLFMEHVELGRAALP